MEKQNKKINKSKKIWRRIGIGFLWLSALYLLLFAPYHSELVAGVYAGESTVFFMWAVKETIVELRRKE